ncbi:MAG: hypothetical protein QOE90_1793 [Thermoplasmata archaeon]|jgi:uncharacterized Zn finger protein (UPF0148 family)|nr:hypothetical protein [Thermoplasmata archaeon]
MSGDARPICPQCGAPLFQRAHGDQTCVQHGHWIPSEVLDATFDANASATVRAAIARTPLTPRKCPDDRYEMSHLSNASGTVQADACGRCGGVWVALSLVEQLKATTPVNAGTDAEARSLLALAAARSLCAPAVPARRR